MTDPYAPVAASNDDAAYQPLTPTLLFEKLAQLKVERERLSRESNALGLAMTRHATTEAAEAEDDSDSDVGHSGGSVGDHCGAGDPSDASISLHTRSDSLGAVPPLLDDSASITSHMERFSFHADDDDETLVGDDALGGALVAMAEEATQALVMSVDEYGAALDAEAERNDGLGDSDREEDGSEYDDDDEEDDEDEDADADGDESYGLIPRSMPPRPADDASMTDHVFWQVTCAVHRALDSITLDLPQLFEESRLGGAALQLARLPTIASDTLVVRAVRSRVDAIIHGRLVSHVQDQYIRARQIVVATVDRDVREVMERSDLLGDDVQVINAHLDALQSRLEALVTAKVALITEAVTRYVREVIPREFDRLLRAIMLREGALLRPVYDRVHDSLLPMVQAFVDVIASLLRQHADWLNTVVVKKVGEDLLVLRQRFA